MKLTENFLLSEYQSKDGAATPLELVPNIKENAKNLQVLREYFDAPIIINSGYRSPSHNKSIGGAKYSQHLQGKASDIVVKGYTPYEVYEAIEYLISEGEMKQGGLSQYNTFVHYDVRGSRARW